jgi:ribosomal protein L11 methyltransferase
MTERLWRIAVAVPDARSADAVAALLDPLVEAITAFEVTPKGDWLVQGFAEGKPERARIEAGLALAASALGIAEPGLVLEPVDDIDWLKENQESFPPLRIGRYFVHGSHVTPPPRSGAIPLLIDAATAFGTGEHATTEGCLRALDRLARRGRRRRILDMGTGTGILAIAAAKTWNVKVLACDIDPHSVRVARENFAVNRVADRVRCRVGDGYRGVAGEYDLIFANILARPLVRMAPDLAHHLAPGGIAILSGLLAGQERFVAAAHRAAGLRFLRRIPTNGWHTLVFRKPYSAGE